jgi:predicted PurR-regulated permease PerM
LFALVVASLLAVGTILKPFIAPIVLALLLVSIFHPVFRKIRTRIGNRENLAAILTVIIVFLLVVIPLAVLSVVIVQQGVEVFNHVKDWVAAGNLEQTLESERVRVWLEKPYIVKIRGFLIERLSGSDGQQFDLAGKLLELTNDTLNYVGRKILPILTRTGLILMNFAIMLFVMFYAFRDGDKMLAYLVQMIPLATTYQRQLVDRIGYIAKAILMGTLLTAATQAIVAMIAFKIVGVPALFLGVMLGIASLVPVVGTALVWVPTVLFLFIIGKTGAAVFLLLWCVLVVGLLDNFLRPYLMQGQSGMSALVLFFAILGGIRLFGPIGIVYGPLIFGLCAVILYIYRIENSAALAQLGRK